MGIYLIYIFSAFLLSFYSLNPAPFKFSKGVIAKKLPPSWEKQEGSLFIASQTGNKRALPKKLKEKFKEIGIIHLLTPSGIHLSSLIIPLKALINKRSIHLIFILLSIISTLYGNFHSIRRVAYFGAIFPFIKSTPLRFSFALILDILLGGFAKSPLSFTYSMLFWGIIIFSKPKRVFLNLF